MPNRKEQDRSKRACIIAWTPDVVGRGPQAAGKRKSDSRNAGGDSRIHRRGPGAPDPLAAIGTWVANPLDRGAKTRK
jgi:hypothetical protein